MYGVLLVERAGELQVLKAFSGLLGGQALIAFPAVGAYFGKLTKGATGTE